jgi:hypothetical protein
VGAGSVLATHGGSTAIIEQGAGGLTGMNLDSWDDSQVTVRDFLEFATANGGSAVTLDGKRISQFCPIRFQAPSGPGSRCPTDTLASSGWRRWSASTRSA